MPVPVAHQDIHQSRRHVRASVHSLRGIGHHPFHDVEAADHLRRTQKGGHLTLVLVGTLGQRAQYAPEVRSELTQCGAVGQDVEVRLGIEDAGSME